MFSIKSRVSRRGREGENIKGSRKKEKRVYNRVTKGETKTDKITQSSAGLTCWSYPRPAKSAGTGCNWSKGRWANPGLTNDRQTRMHPRHGTNHCVPAGAGVKHAMRICAASEGANVGQLQVGPNRSLRAVLCLTLSLTQLIMAQTVMRKNLNLPQQILPDVFSAGQHVFSWDILLNTRLTKTNIPGTRTAPWYFLFLSIVLQL